jgi:hypothetical protein
MIKRIKKLKDNHPINEAYFNYKKLLKFEKKLQMIFLVKPTKKHARLIKISENIN